MSLVAGVAVIGQTLDGFQSPLPSISVAGEYKVQMNSADSAVYATVNGGAWIKIIDSSGLVVTTTLQVAYNGGSTIAVAAGLPVSIAGSGTTVALRLTGGVATSGGLEMGSTATLAVSAANEGRLRYNSGTQTFQVSMNAAAWTDLDTVAGASLQVAYNAGNTITLAAGNPVAIVGTGTIVGLRITGSGANGGLELGSSATLAVSAANEGRFIYNSVTQTFQTSANGGAYATVATVGAITLQAAYNGGTNIAINGASVQINNATGNGSTLLTLQEQDPAVVGNGNVGFLWSRVMTPSGGASFTGLHAFQINNAPITTNAYTENQVLALISHVPTGAGAYTDTATGLSIVMTPASAGAVTGAVVTIGVNSTGRGVIVTHNGSAASTGCVAVRIAGSAQATGLEMSSGGSLNVSAANEGRLRYNSGTQTFQASMNGVAFVDLGTSTSSNLQAAYTAGATITLTAAKPIALTENNTATNTDQGITWTRSVAPAGASVFNGNAIVISNTCTSTNACSESSPGLVSITHAGVAGGNTLTDTTVALKIAMSAAAANTTVVGLSVAMGTNTTGALAALFTGAAISCPHSGARSERFGKFSSATGADSLSISCGTTGGVASAANTVAVGDRSIANAAEGVALGALCTAGVTHSVAIGSFAATTAGDGNIAIGTQSTASGAASLAIGFQATCNSAGSVAVGRQSLAGQASTTAIGDNATANVAGSTAVGTGASCTNNGAIAIGNGAAVTGAGSIAIGTSGAQVVATTAALVIGQGTGITGVYIGNGITNASPANVVYNATGGLGAGIAGASLTIAGGKSGDAATAGGNVNIQTTQAGAGTTLSTILSVKNTGNVAITGVSNSTAASAGVAQLSIDSQATAANVIDCSVFNVSGNLWQLRYRAAQTITNVLTGFKLDLSTNVTPAAQTVVGMVVLMPAATTSSSYGIQISSPQTGGNLLLLSPNSGVTSSLVSALIDRAPSPANTSVYTGGLLKLFNRPLQNGNDFTENGIVCTIVHAPVLGEGGTVVDTTVGLSITMTPVATATCVGMNMTLAANVTAQGIIVTHNGTTAGSAAVSARLAGNSKCVGLESTDGALLAVSNANEGRLRYSNTSKWFEISAIGSNYGRIPGGFPMRHAGDAVITVAVTDWYVDGAPSTSRVVNLPALSTCDGQMFVIKNRTKSVTNTLVITRNGADTIDGATTLTLGNATVMEAVILQADSANGTWNIVSSFAAI